MFLFRSQGCFFFPFNSNSFGFYLKTYEKCYEKYRTKIKYTFLMFDKICLICTHLLLHILLLLKLLILSKIEKKAGNIILVITLQIQNKTKNDAC